MCLIKNSWNSRSCRNEGIGTQAFCPNDGKEDKCSKIKGKERLSGILFICIMRMIMVLVSIFCEDAIDTKACKAIRTAISWHLINVRCYDYFFPCNVLSNTDYGTPRANPEIKIVSHISSIKEIPLTTELAKRS